MTAQTMINLESRLETEADVVRQEVDELLSSNIHKISRIRETIYVSKRMNFEPPDTQRLP